MAIAAGLKELDELEQSEGPFDDNEFDGSTESENDEPSQSLDDIESELKRRADSNAETSLRLREERLKRNEILEKKIHEMKSKLHEQSSSSSLLKKNSSFSLMQDLLSKYRRPFCIGLLTIFTGSFFFYKFYTGHDRTR